MSMKDTLDRANKSENVANGGGWVKLKEGLNQFRLLTEPVEMFEDFKMGICYTDCGFKGSAKFLTYVLDRADNSIKLWKMPYSLFQGVVGYEQDDELRFETFPMPYDIKVTAKGAGTKEVEYALMPSMKQVPVSPETISELGKKTACVEVITKMKEKNLEKHKADGTWQKEQDRKAELKKELADARANGTGQEVDTIEYPTEEINPNDIPF